MVFPGITVGQVPKVLSVVLLALGALVVCENDGIARAAAITNYEALEFFVIVVIDLLMFVALPAFELKGYLGRSVFKD